MKNIKYALVVLAAVVSAASCTEEIENDKPVLGGESAKGDLIINAVAGSLDNPTLIQRPMGCMDMM